MMFPSFRTRPIPPGAFLGLLSTTLLLTAAACSDRGGESALAPTTELEALAADSTQADANDSTGIGPEGGGIPTIIDSVIEDTGQVSLSLVQGGCWTIETPVAPFNPLNLPDELRVDNLQVAFKGTITRPLAGCGIYPGLRLEWIHMVGAP